MAQTIVMAIRYIYIYTDNPVNPHFGSKHATEPLLAGLDHDQ